jgi:hypothetical protein
MGGVVQPVRKAVQTVVGGAAKTANELVGNKSQAAAQAPAPEAAAAKDTRATAIDEMMGARRRGAARRNRSLLSDARLQTPDETLGGGNNL